MPNDLYDGFTTFTFDSFDIIVEQIDFNLSQAIAIPIVDKQLVVDVGLRRHTLRINWTIQNATPYTELENLEAIWRSSNSDYKLRLRFYKPGSTAIKEFYGYIIKMEAEYIFKEDPRKIFGSFLFVKDKTASL